MMTVLAAAAAALTPSTTKIAERPVALPLSVQPPAAWNVPVDWPGRVLPQLEQMSLPATREELRVVLRAVDESARRFHVSPFIILAVIHVESRFDPYAISPAGAIGLMQLRPETAEAVATDLGLPWASDEALFDPEQNVLLGTCYLRQLLDRFDNLDVALAAFNAGPTRIAVRHRRIGAVPLAYPDRVWDVLVDLQAGAHAQGWLAGRIS
jgi:soluble lytic murein transglycosylase